MGSYFCASPKVGQSENIGGPHNPSPDTQLLPGAAPLINLVPIQKWPFRPIAALLGCQKMLTYREYAPLFRLPRALHSNENYHFWTDTI
jgi:hypothetical protein